ncbi:MAG: hypothetical protein ABI870_13120, partial [Rhodanobacter sp.]
MRRLHDAQKIALLYGGLNGFRVSRLIFLSIAGQAAHFSLNHSGFNGMITIRNLRPGIFASGLLLTAFGFVSTAMWKVVFWPPLIFLSGLIGLSLVTAFALKKLFGCTLATAAGFFWLLLLVYFCGLAATISVAILGLSAMALGSMLLPVPVGARPALSILVGLAILSGFIGWLLPFPLHYRIGYLLLLLLLIAWRRADIAMLMKSMAGSWRGATGESAALAILAISVLGVASTFAWTPVIHSDDLSYHLGLPTQLHDLGYYSMAAASNVWSVSAWSGDVVQGMAYLLGNSEAHGAVSVLWAGLTVALLWKLGESLGLN